MQNDNSKSKFFLKKSLGQYLLKDQSVAEKIIDGLDLKPSDTVLEIGPGTGALTRKLVEQAGFVLAVEKDYKMVERLRAEFKSQISKCKIIHKDILRFDEATIKGSYKLVGNLPYNITSPILKKFLESKCKPSLMVVMMQKEVAQRITASPGDSNRGILTLMVEYHGKAQLLFEVPRTSFVPVPKVDSAVVAIHPRGVPQAQHHLGDDLFFRLVKAGFSAKRRQIHNSLDGGLGLSKAKIHAMLKQGKIDAQKRAEDLAIEDWQRLADSYEQNFSDRK